MSSAQAIQRSFYYWLQCRKWSLRSYDPEVVGNIFYDQGFYIAAYKRLESISPEKLNGINFVLVNPNDSVQNFLKLRPSTPYQLYWLAIAEEAWSYFVTKSNYLDANAAYQILRTSLCHFVELPPKTHARIQYLTDLIEHNLQWITQICLNTPTIRLNIHFIDELFRKLWHRSDISTSDKCKFGYQYLSIVEYTFDVKQDLSNSIMHAIYHNRDLFSSEDRAKIELYAAHQTLSPLYDLNIPLDELDDNLRKIETTLLQEDQLACRWLRAQIGLRIGSLQNYEIAEILREIISQEAIYDKGKFFTVDINQTEATLKLVKMRVNNETDIITDAQALEYLDKYSNLYPELVTQLMEQLYLQGRTPSYQRLTVANNTCNTLTYTLQIGDQIDEFTLFRTEQKHYSGLREKGIQYVNVRVFQDGQLLIHHSCVDANSYVACYGDPFKFTVYFEPDASLDSETPTSEMIRQVADVLQQEYKNYQRSYPKSDLQEFIRDLGCDLNPEHRHRYFTRILHGLMRPKQLQRAIQMILDGDL